MPAGPDPTSPRLNHPPLEDADPERMSSGGIGSSVYRRIFQICPEPMWIFDRETLRFLEVNDAACERYGFTKAELLARTVLDLRPPDEIPRFLESLRERHEGHDYTGIWRHQTRAGRILEVEITTHEIDFLGRRAVLVLAHDVTQRLAAERATEAALARVKTTLLATADAVSRIVELRDPYTAGHERRVAIMSADIGRTLGLDPDRVEGLRVAGFLHDLGKITVPAEILAKPGRLSAIEMEIIRMHPERGFEVLRSIDFPWPVAAVAHQHHERIDGSGYPRGLHGPDIVLEARIVAVADVVESMASDRPYRPGLGLAAALEEIEKNAGRLYDPLIATACLRLFREDGYTLPI